MADNNISDAGTFAEMVRKRGKPLLYAKIIVREIMWEALMEGAQQATETLAIQIGNGELSVGQAKEVWEEIANLPTAKWQTDIWEGISTGGK